MIILIGGEKGGTGKTTLATNLAARRAAAGVDVLLVDTDRQGSASFWAALRNDEESLEAVPCVQVFGKGVARQITDLASRYSDVVVDAGGRDSVELRSAMVAADRLYVPVQASQFDVWTLEQMDELVAQAGAINPALQAAVVLNRASTNPRVQEAAEAEALVAEFDNLDVSGVTVRDRIAYRRAAAEGRGVAEMPDPDSKAVAEMEAWYQAVFGDTAAI
ncbi:AAA family ATPase [Rubrivirga sp. IMCC43871]|uniref:nucleotide-binding protein n=1 Tax=Rubrivirga sp. IMCC43871 TaxID=3391575 RepID=UPI00398FAE4A